MKTRHFAPLLFLASALSLFANGGGYLQGMKSTGPFRPVNVENVAMVSEKLDIELKEDAADVSITYHLQNPGKEVTVEMGFPCSVVVRKKWDPEYKKQLPPVLPQLEGFSLKADGEAVESKLVKDHAVLPGTPPLKKEEDVYMENVVTGWQVVKLPFAAGQTRVITVKYSNPYYREAETLSRNESISAPSMRYLFSAAALWAGSIKTGEVTVRAAGVDPEVVSLSHPKRFTRTGNVWKWSFTDFEPTMQDDLEIIAGDHEYIQSHPSEDGTETGSYVMRGKSPKLEDLQKSGKWFYIGKPYKATASSCYTSKSGAVFTPENLNDPRAFNPWAEGVDGAGIGESVTLTMKTPQKVSRLYIANGNPDDEEGFARYNCVKKLAVSVNGAKPFTAELPNGHGKRGTIPIPADAGPVQTVKLTIQEVYPGTEGQVTCISGVSMEVLLSKAPPIFPCR